MTFLQCSLGSRSNRKVHLPSLESAKACGMPISPETGYPLPEGANTPPTHWRNHVNGGTLYQAINPTNCERVGIVICVQTATNPKEVI
jgi:hypothetical protein